MAERNEVGWGIEKRNRDKNIKNEIEKEIATYSDNRRCWFQAIYECIRHCGTFPALYTHSLNTKHTFIEQVHLRIH